MKEMTPRQIVKQLDRYIIGQNSAKKSVAIALRNRWRRTGRGKVERRDYAKQHNHDWVNYR